MRRAGQPIARGTLSPIRGSAGSRNNLIARRHDDVAFLVIPAVAEVEFNWRRTALLENLLQFRLIVLFENFDRTDVGAEDANVPFAAIEIGKRNAGIVLHDRSAVVDDEITDATETFFKHQIRR